MMNDDISRRLSSGCHVAVGNMAPGGGSFIRSVVAFLRGDVALSSSLCDVGVCCGCWVGHVTVGGSGGRW